MATEKPARQVAQTSESIWSDKRIDRVFRDMLKDFFTEGSVRERLVESLASPMRVEEFQEDDTYVIRAELAGIDPAKDIDVQILGGVLTVQARREERTEEDRPDGYHSEFHYGSFRRSLRLPDGTVESDVVATYKDGILEIRVPFSGTPKAPTKVAINHD